MKIDGIDAERQVARLLRGARDLQTVTDAGRAGEAGEEILLGGGVGIDGEPRRRIDLRGELRRFGCLGELVDRLELRGNRSLTLVLARPGSHEPAIVGGADAAHLLEPFTALLDVIGDGVRLTGAGYLPPAVVEQVAAATGISAWWIGKANREDQTAPVADLRAGARALGLLGVRGGRLAPTAVARQGRGQPLVLWEHIVSRLPLGRSPFDRQAGWVSLAVVGSGAPVEQWNAQIRDLMFDLGWRPGDPRLPEYLFVDNPTLQILEMLAGRPRTGRVTTTNPAVAATARAAIRLAAEKR